MGSSRGKRGKGHGAGKSNSVARVWGVVDKRSRKYEKGCGRGNGSSGIAVSRQKKKNKEAEEKEKKEKREKRKRRRTTKGES